MDFPTFFDMDKICRVCLQDEAELHFLDDDSPMELGATIVEMLNECTRYVVDRCDEMPHQICTACIDNVVSAYRFKQQCEQSYRKLITLISSKQKLFDIVVGGSTEGGVSNTKVKCELTISKDKCTQTEDSSINQCDHCDEKFFCYQALEEHRYQSHKGSGVICHNCGQPFNRASYLKTQKAVFHSVSACSSQNQCHICKRQFSRREHMRRHLAVIHKIDEITDANNADSTELDDQQKFFVFGKRNVLKTPFTDLQCIDNRSVNIEKREISANFHGTEYDNSDEREIMSNEDAVDNNDDIIDNNEPLVNLMKSTPTTSFMQVLLNENTTDINTIPDFHELDLETDKSDALSATINTSGKVIGNIYAAENNDILMSKKCSRGRPTSYKSCLLKANKCNICSAHFTSINKFRRHMRTVHDKPVADESMDAIMPMRKKIKCIECAYEFEHMAQYKKHRESKHGKKAYQCNVCQKCFTTKIYLRRHLAIHDRKRYVCKECSKSYITKEELNVHIKEQGHDKPMLCPECGLRCKTSNILMVHMRRHKGEKPFKCKFCSKGFPRMDDLRVHEKYHTGEKSHFCETCGKGFQRKYNLTIHLRVHTGEKPYKCPHCPQAFAQGNDLKAHIRRHTGERFRCEVCGAAFLQVYQIRQHKLMEHGIKEDPPTQRVAKFRSPEEQEMQIKQNLQRELA